MNRLIETSLALMLAAVTAPALALEREPAVSPDAGNPLLDRALDLLSRQQNPLSGMEDDLVSVEGLPPRRDVTVLARNHPKDRDHHHYRPSKDKHYVRPHYDHGHDYGHQRHRDHWSHHHHGHIRYYRPSRYWGYDRYYDYYDGVNLNLILHLDG